MGTSYRTRLAFTLVEALIAGSIAMILASMAMPAISGVIHLTRRMACASNLRQLGLAITAYAGDHGDWLPAADRRAPEPGDDSPTWFCRLPPYFGASNVARGGRVFQCAAWKDGPRGVFTAASPKSLKWNARLEGDGRPRHYRLGTWRDEASVCLMADAQAGETGMGQWGHLVPSGIEDRRHRGAVNVLCLDGHTQRVATCPTGSTWAEALVWVGGRD